MAGRTKRGRTGGRRRGAHGSRALRSRILRARIRGPGAGGLERGAPGRSGFSANRPPQAWRAPHCPPRPAPRSDPRPSCRPAVRHPAGERIAGRAAHGRATGRRLIHAGHRPAGHRLSVHRLHLWSEVRNYAPTGPPDSAVAEPSGLLRPTREDDDKAEGAGTGRHGATLDGRPAHLPRSESSVGSRSPAAPVGIGAKRAKGGRRRRPTFWRELPMLVVVALLLTFLIQTFLARVYEIPSARWKHTARLHRLHERPCARGQIELPASAIPPQVTSSSSVARPAGRPAKGLPSLPVTRWSGACRRSGR